MIHRRQLLGSTVAIGTAVLLDAHPVDADDRQSTGKIVDTNVSLFQWPFRRLPLDNPEPLVNKLRELGLTEAWAGSFEGILHRDMTDVNRRVAKTCHQYDELLPIGTINPMLPGWQQDLRRCIEQHQMPGLRLYPNYHGYAIDDARCFDLIETAAASGRFVQIAVQLEDPRTQHPLVRVPPVDLAVLPGVMRRCRGAKVQLLNCRPSHAEARKLAEVAGIFLDSSHIEGTDGIAKLLEVFPAERLMFGSHAPLLIPEAALIRTVENELTEDQRRRLLWKNAAALLA